MKMRDIFSYISLTRHKQDEERKIFFPIDIFRILSSIADLFLILFFINFISSIFDSFIPTGIGTDLRLKIIAEEELLPEEISIMNQYMILIALKQLSTMVFTFIYVIYCWCKLGSTPIKCLLGMKIIDAETLQKISLKQAIKRFFSFPISALPFGLGIIWSVVDKRGQSLHDKMAKTLVINRYKSSENVDTSNMKMEDKKPFQGVIPLPKFLTDRVFSLYSRFFSNNKKSCKNSI